MTGNSARADGAHGATSGQVQQRAARHKPGDEQAWKQLAAANDPPSDGQDAPPAQEGEETDGKTGANKSPATGDKPILTIDLDAYQEYLATGAVPPPATTGAGAAPQSAAAVDEGLQRILLQIQSGSGGFGTTTTYTVTVFHDLGMKFVVSEIDGQRIAAVYNEPSPVAPIPPPSDPAEYSRVIATVPPQGNASPDAAAENRAPTITTTAISAGEKVAATGRIDATDSDGDPVTFALTQGPTLGTLILGSDGSYTYTPGSALASLAAGQTATDRFTVQASDGKGGTATQIVTVTIAGANDAPSTPTDNNGAVNAAAENAATGTAVGLTIRATDVDGDAITYTLTENAGGRFAINASTGVVTVANGSLIAVGGSYTITVSASDGVASRTADFTITAFDSANDGTLSLSNLNGVNGFRLQGFENAAQAGFSVAGAGDVNGDGFDDIIVGAYGTDAGGADRGESYVVFGKAGGFSSIIAVSSLDGTTGFKIVGFENSAQSGRAVSAAGDINGDGIADLIVGASRTDAGGTDRGESYVIFGQSGGFASSLNLGDLNGTNGFRLTGFENNAQSGRTLAAVGDVNGDGIDDLFIGSPLADSGGSNRGEGYVVFGRIGGFGSAINLSSLDGTSGFKLAGITNSNQAGFSLAGAGDINGDGIADLVIGAPYAANGGSNRGSTYVVFGRSNGFASSISLSSLDGTNGFVLTGIENSSFSGDAVALMDVNGDGFDDLLMGAPYTDAGGVDRGRAYVLFGTSSGFASSISVSDLNGTNGFAITGFENSASMSYSLSSAGDVNGDGYDDMLIGARRADAGGTDRGQAYVIYGKAGGFGSNFDLSSLDGTNGFSLNGFENSARAGLSVASAGDVDGDGYDDLIVGAPLTDVGGNNRGEAYVIFGGNFTATTTFAGDSANNSFTGTAAAERFIGGAGDDTLVGNGGADAFDGGAGNDLIVVKDLSFLRVDGGGGTDRLLFEAAVGAAIDLSNVRGRIEGVERLDFTNGLANTINVSSNDVLDLRVRNDSVNGNASLDNTLTILGDSTDTVDLMGAWTAQGANSGGAGFVLYTFDSAPEVKVAVASDVTVV